MRLFSQTVLIFNATRAKAFYDEDVKGGLNAVSLTLAGVYPNKQQDTTANISLNSDSIWDWLPHIWDILHRGCAGPNSLNCNYCSYRLFTPGINRHFG